MFARRRLGAYPFVLSGLILACGIVPGLLFIWRQLPPTGPSDAVTSTSPARLFGPSPIESPAGDFRNSALPLSQTQVTTHLDPSSLRSFRVEPAVRIDSGGTSAAAEVSMVAEGDDVVAAWIDLRSGVDRARVAVAVSHDFGLTWHDQLLQPTGDPDSDDLHGDPMTAHDPRTGQLWAGGLAFFDHSLFVARHLPSTSEFTPPVTFGRPFIVDKPWLAAGSPPGAPQSTRLYAIDAVGDLFVSDDLGLAWNVAGSTQIGLGHLPRVGPNSELYVAYRGGQDNGCWIQRSTDGGSTFDPPRNVGLFQPFFLESFIPGEFRAPAFCVLAVDPTDGTLFMAVAGFGSLEEGTNDVDILLTRSEDQGLSWTAPQVINGGPASSQQFLPWLEVDDSGRLHLVYLDTRRIPQDDNAPNGWLDVYYSTSDDGGLSWIEVPVTAQAFDTSTSGWLNGISQFVGDYLGLAVSDDRVIVSYAATYGGDLDIYAQSILLGPSQIFGDGFESGDAGAWSTQIP